MGTVEVTFSNVSLIYNTLMMFLQNSDGYVLTSLSRQHERYIATYPANGEMMVVFNDSMGYSYGTESEFTFGWECNTGPAVVPAAGFDASTYLTLPPTGTYKRLYSEISSVNWIIPCTGTLDIAASSISKPSALTKFQFISNGTVLHTGQGSFSFEGNFSVAGNFIITLWVPFWYPPDSVFTFAWSCGGTRPDIPSHDPTPAPETRVPPTVVPLSPCESLSSPPLVAAVTAPLRSGMYSECWTFQCVGTVEVTFANISLEAYYERLVLKNSDGYVLTSLTESRERYIATYPANGEMMLVFNDTRGFTYAGYHDSKFTFEWVCNTGLAVVPAAGFDASTYLTLPPAGSYERFNSEQLNVNWIIPCTGILNIAAISQGDYTTFQFINGDGTILYTGEDTTSIDFNGNLSVAGNFTINLVRQYKGSYDDEFAFAWSCGGTRPDLPSHDLTPAPETREPPTPIPLSPWTRAPLATAVPTDLPAGASSPPGSSAPLTALPTATPTDLPIAASSAPTTPAPETRVPPTVVPLSPCESLSSPPLVATVEAPIRRASYSECWTFQCVGTVEVTFSNVSLIYNTLMMFLQNSDGYVLTSLSRQHERYIATYPANGEMMVVFNDSMGYSYGAESEFTFEWECNTGPAVVPAAGFDASTYLTLPPTGTYKRLYSEISSVNWIIPCTGTLDIAASSISKPSALTKFQFISNGTVLHTGQGSFSFEGNFSVAGNFIITLWVPFWYPPDSVFTFAWSCGGTRPDIPTHDLTPAPETRVPRTLVPLSPWTSTPLATAVPTDLPAGASSPPGSSAPLTALPTATPTDLPIAASSAPTTPAPDTALPTATPTNLPAGASSPPGTSAPTSASDTALPTATPTDQPAAATFAPPAPAVKALCTADKDCRSGRLDPKATCNAGTCVCHTQGYVHPTGVPLCLLADDVTVPMAFAVEYDGVEAGSLWTTATTRESFEDTMYEALGTVTDMRVVVSDGGVLVVGMVRASTAKLADALSGKVDLSAALSSDSVSVSHGVTCARTDASYTVQHNGVCDAVECEGNTTLTLTDGTYTCEREATPPQPEESGGSSNVVLYVGIGVGVLVVAVCVVAAFCCLQKKQRVKELDDPLFDRAREDAELYPTGVDEAEADPAEELILF